MASYQLFLSRSISSVDAALLLTTSNLGEAWVFYFHASQRLQMSWIMRDFVSYKDPGMLRACNAEHQEWYLCSNSNKARNE